MINCVSIFFGEHLQKELNKDESERVEQFARYDNIGVSQSGGVTLNPRLNPCVSIHFNMSSNTVCILPFKTVNLGMYPSITSKPSLSNVGLRKNLHKSSIFGINKSWFPVKRCAIRPCH